jgi:hypothetical protein
MLFRRKPKLLADTAENAAWRRELDGRGEAAVRAEYELRSAARGEGYKAFVVEWLREQELKRQARERTTYWVTIATLWVAGLALAATIIGIFVALKH